MKISPLFALLGVFVFQSDLFSQQNQEPKAEQLSLSGHLQANGNFFLRDSLIGAANTPQYDRQLFGAETWLTINAAYKGFEGGLRFDLFNNSNLLNPTDSYSDQGIGRWWIKKKVQKLELTGGYIYDQIGAGTIFRAYEERPLMIDNALFGVRAAYDLPKDFRVKVFAGKQKFLFSRYGCQVRGAAIDGAIKLDSAGRFRLIPGAGIVARTYDETVASSIAAEVGTYTKIDSIAPKYNTFAATFYNTLIAGPVSWYVEASVKTPDVMNDPFAEKLNWSGQKTVGKLVNRRGNIFYSSLTFAQKGLGITVEGKRTQDFTFRTEPFVSGFRGMINFLPPMARQNTYRLTARYQPATQELGEQSGQIDLRYKFSKKWAAALNLSAIDNLDGTRLYREIYSEFTWKASKKTQLIGGLQRQIYNQSIYEGKKVDDVQTITPYAELLHKITRKRSVRVEAQYMNTAQDFGSWVFGLVEVGLAPHWIFTVSDMFKLRHDDPSKYPADKTKFDGKHFPTAGAVYIAGPNRFSLDFVKQVEGIVCSGGICRYEPAFSGVRFKISSNF